MRWVGYTVIDMKQVSAVAIREIGWVTVVEVEEVPFVLDLGGRSRSGRRAYRILTDEGEEFIITPGIVEAVQK